MIVPAKYLTILVMLAAVIGFPRGSAGQSIQQRIREQMEEQQAQRQREREEQARQEERERKREEERERQRQEERERQEQQRREEQEASRRQEVEQQRQQEMREREQQRAPAAGYRTQQQMQQSAEQGQQFPNKSGSQLGGTQQYNAMQGRGGSSTSVISRPTQADVLQEQQLASTQFQAALQTMLSSQQQINQTFDQMSQELASTLQGPANASDPSAYFQGLLNSSQMSISPPPIMAAASAASGGAANGSGPLSDPAYCQQKAADCRQMAAQENALANGPQGAFHAQAAQAYLAAAAKYDAQAAQDLAAARNGSAPSAPNFARVPANNYSQQRLVNPSAQPFRSDSGSNPAGSANDSASDANPSITQTVDNQPQLNGDRTPYPAVSPTPTDSGDGGNGGYSVYYAHANQGAAPSPNQGGSGDLLAAAFLQAVQQQLDPGLSDTQLSDLGLLVSNGNPVPAPSDVLGGVTDAPPPLVNQSNDTNNSPSQDNFQSELNEPATTALRNLWNSAVSSWNNAAPTVRSVRKGVLSALWDEAMDEAWSGDPALGNLGHMARGATGSVINDVGTDAVNQIVDSLPPDARLDYLATKTINPVSYQDANTALINNVTNMVEQGVDSPQQ